MPTYVELNGVRTWFDEHGAGAPLVLLHPGLVDSRAFGPNLEAFAAKFRVFTPERRGHGRTPDVGPITFELMAEDTIQFLEEIVGGEKLARIHLVEPALTAAELSRVTCRTLVMQGDDDEVALEHALALYSALPNSELAVIPGASHGLLVEKAEICNRITLDFLCNEPVKTFAPIRRAARQRQ
jgi:pimeloyl-ACP methyl ester carboxylesterase